MKNRTINVMCRMQSYYTSHLTNIQTVYKIAATVPLIHYPRTMTSASERNQKSSAYTETNQEDESTGDSLDFGDSLDDHDEPFASKTSESHELRHEYLKETLPTACMTSSFEDANYKMAKKRRGYAVIFNNKSFDNSLERKGSDKDVIALEKCFGHEYLGFDVIVHPDLTTEEIKAELLKLSMMDHSECDCLCVIVLTHGLRNEVLRSKDGIYLVDDLWTPFLNDRCLELSGKPKFFFVQACRGRNADYGAKLVRASLSEVDGGPGNQSYVIPTHSDILLAFSTFRDSLSPRDPVMGTWYIQSLCRVFQANYLKMDLLSMLTIVHREVALNYNFCNESTPEYCGMKVTPMFVSTLMRNVLFLSKNLDI